MEARTKSPPPRGSTSRLLGWEEWYMTGEGVAAYLLFSLFGWIVLIAFCLLLFGPPGVMIGHILGIFVGIPVIGELMTRFWPPRKLPPYKW